VCSDFSHLSEFSKQLSNSQFRLLKQYLPGPFTFLLEANKDIAKIFNQNKKTVGFRIPDSQLVIDLVRKLDAPIFSSSIQVDSVSPYATTADEIWDEYNGKVDLIIDGGICGEKPTTIIDLTSDSPEIVRKGAGVFDIN
jgi:tRNA threonylcarbamoyl adenosine modification protein (Sua5/YciO/YrdC/YwlC family)